MWDYERFYKPEDWVKDEMKSHRRSETEEFKDTYIGGNWLTPIQDMKSQCEINEIVNGREEMNLIDTFYKEAKKLKVLVIGDICLDINSIGEYSGISRESPKKPIFKVSSQIFNLGGAGNLAMNLRKIGVDVTAIGLVGRDIYGTRIRNIMRERRIKSKYIVDSLKTYVFAKFYHESGEHVSRMDILGSDVNERENEELAENFSELMNSNNFDAIFIADYDENNKGVFSSNRLLGVASYKRATTKYFGTSRARLAMFDFLDYIFLNEEELISQFGFNKEYFINNKKLILKDMNTSNVILTLGKEGISVFSNSLDIIQSICTRQTAKTCDTCGCGDTLMAYYSLSNLMGLSIIESGRIANSAARVVTTKHFGVGYATKEEIENHYRDIYESQNNS